MTFEEWYEANQNFIPFADKELGAAWELIKYFWGAGYDHGAEDSDPGAHYDDPADLSLIKSPLSALDGLPGMDGYTYDQFSKDSERW